MLPISRFAILLVLLSLAACNGSGIADKTGPKANPGPGPTAPAELPDGGEGKVAAKPAVAAGATDFIRLSAVRLSSENFYANVDLVAEVEVVPPVPEGIAFEYRWYVNNQEVADATGPVLKKGNFRKGQWIVCQARALAGGKISGWLKSNWVRAADSPPQIEAVPVESFSVPGLFTYQLRASDVDNDELTYALLAPLAMGIELDKKTGLLTWNLDNALVEKVGESIEISLSVSDNDGPPVTGSLTLRFQKKTEKKNP
jgi:hypothetical protein